MNAEIILIYIAVISVMAIFIALLTSLIKKIFGSKLSPVFHYYIWLLFVLRLVFPVLPESNLSVYNFATGIYKNLNSAAQYEFKDNGVNKNFDMSQIDADIQTAQQNQTDTSNGNQANSDSSIQSNLTIITNILLMIYFAVAISGLTVYIYSYMKYRRRIIKTFTLASDREILLLEDIKRTLNIRKNIRLYKGGESLLIGVFSPVIVLSDNCNENDKSAVIAHELTHYKSKDNIINVILSVIKCVYWFNPFVHYFIRKIKDDMELLCDMKSIKKLNYRKDEYAMMLFNSSKKNNKNIIKKQIPSGALGMSSSGRQLLYRLKFISNFKKPGKIASIIATVIVIVLLVTTCTNPIGTSGLNSITVSDYAGNLVSSLKNIDSCLPDTFQVNLKQITSADDLINKINADNPSIKFSGTDKLKREQLAYMTNFFLNFLGISAKPTENKLTVLPIFIEKSIYENTVEPVKEKDMSTYRKLNAYFALKDPSDPTLDSQARQEMLITYPICKSVPVYVFDQNSSVREQQAILEYLNQYTSLTDADVIKMNIQYKLFNNLTPDNTAPNAHVISINLLEINDINNGGVYSDFNKVSDYAKDSVNKLYSFGIITGASGSKFSPAGFVTSEESANIINNIVYGLLIY
ncbi:MAG: S-layer homology domain-containing protein [Oscillospiraceae bacterium]|nr:S-layer homology domain-containing protein [Oscillospiraceae bacterium]